MPSLRDLLAAHGSVLIVDTAGPAQAVWWTNPLEPAASACDPAEAGVGLYRALSRLPISPLAAGAWAFCSAPGSILGIRTAAAALQTWQALADQPCYAYHALQLLAFAHDDRRTAWIADARRGRWHWQVLGAPPERISADEAARRLALQGLQAATPDGFRSWSALPEGVRKVPYAIAPLFARAIDAPLFELAPDPDAVLAAEPAYAAWTPRIHQAP